MNSLVELFFKDSSLDEDDELEMPIALYADTMANKKLKRAVQPLGIL